MLGKKSSQLKSSQNECLQYLLLHYKLTIEDVQSEIEGMKNKEYLQSHMYEIWQGKDGRWRTHLPNATTKSGRRLIAKNTREKLELEIIQYYKSVDEGEQAKRITLKSWYQKWLNYKKLQTRSDMYIRRIAYDWEKYYQNDSLSEIPLINLEFDTLQEWVLRIVKEKRLTKKQYYNMTVIIRQALDYAVQKKMLSENPFSSVHVDSKLFQIKRKPANNTQVFLTDEQPQIEEEAWNDFYDTGAVACLAIPLAFQTGLRIGELVALKESDIEGNYIHIQRMEIRKIKQLDNNSWSKQTYTIANYTKSEAGERKVYITNKAQKIITTIISSNRKNHYIDNEFLFVNENGRINSQAITYRIRKYCRIIGIPEKVIHKVRKTYISTLIDSGLNINEVRKIAGHENERTTYGNYCFNRMTSNQTENLIEKALS